MSCTFSYLTHANIAWASTYWTKLKTIPFITIKSMLHVLLSMKINWHTIIFPMLNWNNFPLKIGYLIFQKFKKKEERKKKEIVRENPNFCGEFHQFTMELNYRKWPLIVFLICMISKCIWNSQVNISHKKLAAFH